MAKVRDAEGGTRRAPKGHFVVYVGEERRRFVVPTTCLKSPAFQQLLEKAAEEYGFGSSQGILLPCDESAFLRVLEATSAGCRHDNPSD